MIRKAEPGGTRPIRLDGYWIVSLFLVVFGFIAALSIGRPFLMVGLTLIVLRPLRDHPALFWPPLAAVIAWNVGFFAIAPFQCTAQAIVGSPVTTGAWATTCSSLIGVTQAGPEIYNPSLEPANQAALVAAAAALVVTVAVARAFRRRKPGGSAA